MKIAVSFGGGGIEALYWLRNCSLLEDFDFADIDVYGTSAGAIYGAGVKSLGVEKFHAFLDEIRPSSLRQIPSSFMKLKSIDTGDGIPEGLNICVTNAYTWKVEMFDSSSSLALHRAVRASCAIPGLVPPVIHKGTLYFDGGLPSGASNTMFIPDEYDEILAFMPFGVQTYAEGDLLQRTAYKGYRNAVSNIKSSKNKVILPSLESWKEMYQRPNLNSVLHLVSPLNLADHSNQEYLIFKDLNILEEESTLPDNVINRKVRPAMMLVGGLRSRIVSFAQAG